MNRIFECVNCGTKYTEEEFVKYHGDCQECGDMMSWIGNELPKSEVRGE